MTSDYEQLKQACEMGFDEENKNVEVVPHWQKLNTIKKHKGKRLDCLPSMKSRKRKVA